MTDLRKAAEMALEALNDDPKMLGDWLDNLKTAREALRQALARPEQEPVGWMCSDELVRKGYIRISNSRDETWNIPLYTAPPKREWVGLTRKEAEDVVDDYITIGGDVEDWVGYWRAIEAKLKEKNT